MKLFNGRLLIFTHIYMLAIDIRAWYTFILHYITSIIFLWLKATKLLCNVRFDIFSRQIVLAFYVHVSSSCMRVMNHNWSATKQFSSAECSRDKPPFSFVRVQDSTMWNIVWVSPQGHRSVSVKIKFARWQHPAIECWARFSVHGTVQFCYWYCCSTIFLFFKIVLYMPLCTWYCNLMLFTSQENWNIKRNLQTKQHWSELHETLVLCSRWVAFVVRDDFVDGHTRCRI